MFFHSYFLKFYRLVHHFSLTKSQNKHLLILFLQTKMESRKKYGVKWSRNKKNSKSELAEFPSVPTGHTVYECCHRLIGRSCLKLGICAFFALALSEVHLSFMWILHLIFRINSLFSLSS